MKLRTLLALSLLLAQPVAAAITVVDGTGSKITLVKPAQRIISLVPHATENLFAAGAGGKIVGTVEYSNHPAAAKKIPRIGSFNGFSVENVLRLRPDLVVAWSDGGSPRELERLKRLGVPVYISDPFRPDDVADEILRMGRLAGTEKVAASAAAAYRNKLASLTRRYSKRPPVTVFYQLSQAPIFTISRHSFLDSLIRLCGGVNVFANLGVPAPQVSTASVVAALPQVILAGDSQTLKMWQRWSAVPAVAKNTLFVMPGDAISVPGPRMVDGAAKLCTTLDLARQRLGLTAR